MNISTMQQLPVQERIAIRSERRSLDNFLDHRFGENKKLALFKKKVNGCGVQCLKSIDAKQIRWYDSPYLWWNDTLNLGKISLYLTEKVPLWEKFLQNDSEKLVVLERQCALLEKVFERYSKKKVKGKPYPTPILNPFKKVVRIEISYPAVIGQPKQETVIHDIHYDRLTKASELANRVEEVIRRPVLIKISSLASLQTDKKFEYSFSVVPKTLFRKLSQDPQELFDPSDDQIRDRLQVVRYIYDDPDPGVLSVVLFNAGEKQALPNIYEQGFAAGQAAGYAEAVQKFKAVFSK